MLACWKFMTILSLTFTEVRVHGLPFMLGGNKKVCKLNKYKSWLKKLKARSFIPVVVSS